MMASRPTSIPNGAVPCVVHLPAVPPPSPDRPAPSAAGSTRGATTTGSLRASASGDADDHRDPDRLDGCAHRRGVPTRPGPHRDVGRAAVAGGPDRPVDARRQPDQVAPGPHHLVLRDVRARPARRRLRALPPGLRLPLQLLLRGGRASGIPGPSGAWSPARRRRGRRVPPRTSTTAMADAARRSASAAEVAELVELGLHHEQQHQELLLMDIKHVLSSNPLEPAYRRPAGAEPSAPPSAAGLGRARRRPRRGRPRRRRASPSTTRVRATAPGSSPSRWPTGW